MESLPFNSVSPLMYKQLLTFPKDSGRLTQKCRVGKVQTKLCWPGDTTKKVIANLTHFKEERVISQQYSKVIEVTREKVLQE